MPPHCLRGSGRPVKFLIFWRNLLYVMFRQYLRCHFSTKLRLQIMYFLFFVRSGTRPYFEESHTGKRFCAAHDHPEFKRTLGLGEFVAELNGVQFRTRHNDYQLQQPGIFKSNFLKMDDIELPKVPPSVLKAGVSFLQFLFCESSLRSRLLLQSSIKLFLCFSLVQVDAIQVRRERFLIVTNEA